MSAGEGIMGRNAPMGAMTEMGMSLVFIEWQDQSKGGVGIGTMQKDLVAYHQILSLYSFDDPDRHVVEQVQFMLDNDLVQFPGVDRIV